jgi:hypothetical protein
MEELMVKKDIAKKYVVHYKTLNEVLKSKKNELEKIEPKVTRAAQREIKLQIQTIDKLLDACRPRMSKAFDAKSLTAKMSAKNCPKLLTARMSAKNCGK